MFEQLRTEDSSVFRPRLERSPFGIIQTPFSAGLFVHVPKFAEREMKEGFNIQSPISTGDENQEDAELVILENIYASQNRSEVLKQRDLAIAAGASLGMTNAILKRLALKGLIVIRKINSRNIQYAVTPDGVNEIARKSYRYFKRTIRNVVFYRDRIDESVARAKRRGAQAVLLIGVSDLDFIVEHSCDRHGLPFLKAVDMEVAASARGARVFSVYAENMQSEHDCTSDEALFLSTILSGKENG